WGLGGVAAIHRDGAATRVPVRGAVEDGARPPTPLHLAEPSATVQAGPETRSASHRPWVWVTLATGLAIAVTAAMWNGRASSTPSPTVDRPMRVVPLTSMSGLEETPTFSPDGAEVAFMHGEFDPGAVDMFGMNWGIYLTTVGSADTMRLSPNHRGDRV